MMGDSFKISNFLPKKSRFIGLDIGSSSIKLAELVYKKGKLVLSKLKLKQIESKDDSDDGLLDAIKSLFAEINTQGAKINVVFNSFQGCMKICVVPFMPKSEILEALKWEMRKFISFPIDEAAIDFKVIREMTVDDVKKLEVAVACCPKEIVDKHIDLLSSAGIRPSSVTMHGVALKNVIKNLCSEDNKTVALLDIGYNFSELFIFQDGEPIFNRKLTVAGRDFTQDMTQSLASDSGKTELTLEEAEEIKKKYGIVDNDSPEMLEGKISGTDLAPLLRPNLEKLLTEIERSFAYCREKEHGAQVELLVLLGGGGNLKNLTNTFSDNLYIPVKLGNPFEHFPMNESCLSDENIESSNRYVSALGVAMALSDDINLLPEEIKHHTKLIIKRNAIRVLAAAGVVLLVLLYTGMKLSLNTLNKRIAAAQLELTALSPQMGKVPEELLLQKILNQRVYWSDVLKEVSNLIPDQICLTEMNAEESTLTLKGHIKSSALSNEKVLADFMSSLEKGIFKKVNLVSTRDLSHDNVNAFELKLSVE
jgi:type IV pilus assembly protein PilM